MSHKFLYFFLDHAHCTFRALQGRGRHVERGHGLILSFGKSVQHEKFHILEADFSVTPRAQDNLSKSLTSSSPSVPPSTGTLEILWTFLVRVPVLGAVLGRECGEQLFNKRAALAKSVVSNFCGYSKITARLLKFYRTSDLSTQCIRAK